MLIDVLDDFLFAKIKKLAVTAIYFGFYSSFSVTDILEFTEFGTDHLHLFEFTVWVAC